MTAPPSPAASPPRSLAAEIAGWYGSAAILGAYAAVSFRWLAPQHVVAQLLNLTGALGVAWVCWRRRTWQPFWLEAVWAAIAAVTLVRGIVG